MVNPSSIKTTTTLIKSRGKKLSTLETIGHCTLKSGYNYKIDIQRGRETPTKEIKCLARCFANIFQNTPYRREQKFGSLLC